MAVPEPRRASAAPAAGRAALLIAFATVYLVWGSTYLAIRIAVGTIPPFVLATVRFGLAGGGLFLYLRARGVPAPNRRQWGGAAVIGALLLAGGNGTVCWAEQWVPSSETALFLATVPLWMTILPWRRGRAPHPAALVGVAIGLCGVATLVSAAPRGAVTTPDALLGGRLALLLASLSWAVGSLWSRRLPLPEQPAMATALEMLTASPLLAVAAHARGEWRAFHLDAVTREGWFALGYLIVAGSLAGFGAYVYLLKHTSAARASTYAFVNPLVAVLLGSLIAGEAIGLRTGIAALLIVGAVGAVLWGSGARRQAPADLS